jgi:hypothetical protein
MVDAHARRKGLDKIAERFLERAAVAKGWELSQRRLRMDGAEAIQYSALTVEGSGEPVGHLSRLDESGRPIRALEVREGGQVNAPGLPTFANLSNQSHDSAILKFLVDEKGSAPNA